MKRALPIYGKDLSGKRYWRSLGELERSPAFADSLAREFPEGASEAPSGVGRRQFLSIMGASLALAGLSGCRRPEETIVPYSRAPEEVVPGRPLFFATAAAFQGTAFGLLVESHEGRPTKIEGNPRHPESLGATTAMLQAMVLDLYDPDRSDAPRERGQKRSWDEAAAFLRRLGDDMKKRRGRGFAVLTEDHRSPTLAALLAEVASEMPEARVVRYAPFSRENARRGAQIAFGRRLDAVLDVAKAKVVVALDADILADGSSIKQARGFTEGRSATRVGPSMNRLYAVESAYSLTGAAADHRLRLASRDVARFATALAREIGGGPDLPAPSLDDRAARFARAVAADLLANKGAGLVVAGRGQPPFVHAIVNAVNVVLGNVGETVRFVAPFDAASEGPEAVVELADAIRGGKVDTLLVLGGNPAFDAPADARLGEAMAGITTIHLSTHVDDTGSRAAWHLNRAHVLEGWSDVRAEDGTASVVQPLIAPLFGGKTEAEVVDLLLGHGRRAYDLVRATWQSSPQAGLDFERSFRRALHDGLWQGSASSAERVTLDGAAVSKAARALGAPGGGFEVTFHPDPHAHDGRFANNGWLQELPEPMTKLTWGNAARVAPATARELGLEDGDVVAIELGGASIETPVLIAPGQAEHSIALWVGQGRQVVGRVGMGAGVDVNPIRQSRAFDLASGATLRKTGRRAELARTQEHFAMEGRPLVREGTVAEHARDPEFARKLVEHPPLESLWEEHKYEGHAWGLNIDLDACIGCNACTVACQAENNIPVVGAEGVKMSREMHWIRVDRYFEGPAPDEPSSVAQPTMCNHCENAPCEQVCPVGATSHSPEGLNDMAYNRCIGTRYCANNCPFKVRKFNFFEYNGAIGELGKMRINPDVTVRSRGVMEKCTFCVQRVNHAKIDAKREGRERLRDGEVVTACQQACPTQAIVFGDLNDPKSRVAARAADPRSYKLLEELNIKPRVSYLAKIKNPNPALEGA